MFYVVIMSSTKGDGVATIDPLTMRLKLQTLLAPLFVAQRFVNLVWSALAAYFSSYRVVLTVPPKK